MATKEAKKHCRRKKGIDRISELPNPLIHHILSFLPTLYAVRTSILSKHWRYMWIYTPVLHFEDSKVGTFRESSMFFVEVVSNYLKHRCSLSLHDTTFITRFKLHMDFGCKYFGSIHGEINDWLSNDANNGKLKELYLCINPCKVTTGYQSFFFLPRSVVNLRSLTLLKLKGFSLEDSFPVNLPSLKVVCLERVNFYGHHSLQNLISGCPIIEDLHLRNIDFFQQRIDLVSSRTLRNLILWGLELSNQQVEDLVCRHPLLEKLTICSCSNLENIFIHSHSLKSLFLRHNYPIGVKIRTPNLVSFVYEAPFMSSTLVFDAPNLLEATLKLLDTRCDTTCVHLILFLSSFQFLKKMTLCFCFEENVIIPKYVRNICCPPLPTLKYLKVKTDNDELWTSSEMRDSFLWCAPSLKTFEMEYISYNYMYYEFMDKVSK